MVSSPVVLRLQESRMPAAVEVAGDRGFAGGLLLDLLAALRRTRPGELIAVTTSSAATGDELGRWAQLTGNTIVASSAEPGGTRFVLRHGRAPDPDGGGARPLGSRLWLYTNYDCNLACDYCCVRSSPRAPRRELGLARTRRIAREAPPLGVRELFVTGGEPFLLPDIGDLLSACAEALPTTVLTNGMLFAGRRLEALRALPRDRVTLQVSLDAPEPAQHDAHRGEGTWQKAWEGVRIAREAGFRVRLAATVGTEEDAARFHAFLEREGVAPEDRVVRPIARRGVAQAGVALGRADLAPEITIAADGVYWHPVGADDRDLLVTAEIFPLRAAFEAVRRALDEERRHHEALMSVFHCA